MSDNITNVYATHLPVLRELGRTMYIKRVLELGCGIYSTPLFLDRTAYPDLELLMSVEDDWDWLQKIKAEYYDRRLTLRYGSWREAAHWVDVEDYNLIFIDSGKTIADRVPVIAGIAALKPSAVVVIHDYEQWDYQHAAQPLGEPHIYSSETPWTAVFYAHLRDRA